MTDSSDSFLQIIKAIQVDHPCWYLFSIFCYTLLIRFILCFFKAWALVNGEQDNKEQEIKLKDEPYCHMFWLSFWSNSKRVAIDDYWLPAIVGAFELAVYPILMSQGRWIFIGAWIGIKTASSWGGWQKHRTAYNRFLLGNILSLGFSMLITWLCV